MKHILGRNTLRSPTQKDFTYIFQWLYHRIDPGYKFQKAVDSEVPTILRNLRYPYEKSITKSQIAAVGGQNWPIYFAMLHWLMQLAQMMERYVVGDYDEACLEAGVDITDDRITYASSLAPTTIGSRGEKMRMTAWRRSA
jgi:kinetochore protein NDC80